MAQQFERTGGVVAANIDEGTGVEPLRLFRTLVVHESLAGRMRPLGAGILAHGLLEPRDREVMIDRTCARCGAEYEWGVHATFFGPTVGFTPDQLAATVTGDADDPVWSERERAVLELMASGKTNPEIGEALHLSRHTVKEHSSAVYRKLGVRNRTEAVQRAQRLGLFT